ncbi:MAG: hypothetical protein PHT03_04050 [Bacilli bacterium]|nr:hypothetical protein [Bacilli bacterium]MDD4388791.1 hypothetical protein [Bacilli bacterium]
MKKVMFWPIIIMIILLCGCSQTKNCFVDDYPMMRDVEHVYKKVGYKEIINAFTVNPGVNIVLFGFDTRYAECPFCIACVPLLNDVAAEMGIEKILYIDIYQMRKERTAEYLILLGYLDGIVGDLLEKKGLKEIIVPDVYVIKDGIILGHHIATVKDEEERFIYDLSEAQKEEVKAIYRNLLMLI